VESHVRVFGGGGQTERGGTCDERTHTHTPTDRRIETTSYGYTRRKNNIHTHTHTYADLGAISAPLDRWAIDKQRYNGKRIL